MLFLFWLFTVISVHLPAPTAPLVDSSPRHSSSAMLMLLSVVFLGLAVFLIYKFKRCTSFWLLPPAVGPHYIAITVFFIIDDSRWALSRPIYYSHIWYFQLIDHSAVVTHTCEIPVHEACAAISHKIQRKRAVNGLICGFSASDLICWINYSSSKWFFWKVWGKWKSCH